MRRLKNFLKQIENEFANPTDEELNYILGEVKNYLIDGDIPENKFARRLAYQIVKGQKDMFENNILPSMPSEAWMKEHGTRDYAAVWAAAVKKRF